MTCEELKALIDNPNTSPLDRANYQAQYDAQECGGSGGTGPTPGSGGGGGGKPPVHR